MNLKVGLGLFFFLFMVSSPLEVYAEGNAHLSAHGKQVKALYDELQGFKNDPLFKEVGFGTCCRFNSWLVRAKNLSKAATVESLRDFNVLPSE